MDGDRPELPDGQRLDTLVGPDESLDRLHLEAAVGVWLQALEAEELGTDRLFHRRGTVDDRGAGFHVGLPPRDVGRVLSLPDERGGRNQWAGSPRGVVLDAGPDPATAVS